MQLSQGMNKMYQGVVRKKTEKGYGFIAYGDGEIFFHVSQCVTPYDSLNINDKVHFDAETTPKGMRAIKVTKT